MLLKQNGQWRNIYASPLATAPGVVFHGADGTVSRPSGFAYIQWVGTVEPDNAQSNDLLIRTDLDSWQYYDGAAWIDLGGGGTLGELDDTSVSGTEPSSPSVDDFWFDTSKNVIYRYDGSTWQSLNSNVEDIVVDHGAVGDGVADDTNAVQNAINQQGVIKFPAGTYRITSGLTVSDNTHLELDPDAILDFSDASSTATMMTATGSFSDSTSLTSNAALHDRTINVNNGSPFNDKDLVRLRSDREIDPVGGGPMSGEFHIALESTSTSVTFRDGVWDLNGYDTANNAILEKANMVYNISIIGGTIRGAGVSTDQIFAEFTYCRKLHFERVRIEDFGERIIDVQGCVDIVLTNSEICCIRQTSKSYGITLRNGCQWVRISDNWFYSLRAPVSSGGTSGDYGMNRWTTITGNAMYDVQQGGMRAHAAHDGCTFSGNTITGADQSAGLYGLLWRGLDISITGNVFYGTSNPAIRIHAQADGMAKITISGNTCDSNGVQGIRVNTDRTHARIESLVITGNSVVRWGWRSGDVGVYIITQYAGSLIQNISITGNVINNNIGSTNIGTGVRLRIINGDGTIRDGVISGNMIKAQDSPAIRYTGNISRVPILSNNLNGDENGIESDGSHQDCFIAANLIVFGSGFSAISGFTSSEESSENYTFS